MGTKVDAQVYDPGDASLYEVNESLATDIWSPTADPGGDSWGIGYFVFAFLFGAPVWFMWRGVLPGRRS